MKNHIYNYSAKALGLALMLVLSLSLTNCDGLLDADNPNNLTEDRLEDSRAFGPMVNGLESTVVRAYGNMLAPYSTASDEMIWIGSRDAWQQLNFGNIADPLNEFTDAAFPFVGEARWWADDVIRRGEEFISLGVPNLEEDLGRAYLFGAFTYMMIADMFDDFVVTSDKLTPGNPVGPGSMNSLYTTAIDYIDRGLALSVSGSLTTALTGLKARAQFSSGIWEKLNPVNTASPLVNNSTAASTATTALGLMGADYKFYLETDPSAPGTVGGLDIAGEVNSRLEMRLSDEYVISTGTTVAALGDGDPATSISLMDPIDNIPDPALYTNVKNFTEAFQHPDYPIVSAREMYLILAEHALANDDMTGFTDNINALRALDGLSAYSGQMDATELLVHSRRVNLYLSGRRIADHYRFDDPSVYWVAQGDAVRNPGTFFPITITEIQANPNIN